MHAISYSELRRNLKSVMDDISQRHEPVIVMRQYAENMILISESDYSALEETAYLLRNPKNAERLLRSLKDSRAGKVKLRKLIKE